MPDQPIELLHPGMVPDESPVDFRRMGAESFRELFQSYEEVSTAGGANQWGLSGAFIVRDANRGVGNYTLVTLRLYDGDDETAHVRLTPLSMVEPAETLLGYAVACANVNGEH